jgi:hypothetical protein
LSHWDNLGIQIRSYSKYLNFVPADEYCELCLVHSTVFKVRIKKIEGEPEKPGTIHNKVNLFFCLNISKLLIVNRSKSPSATFSNHNSKFYLIVLLLIYLEMQ